MKLNKFILSFSVALFASLGVQAQTGLASGTPYGVGADSARCRQNLSLFSSYAKAGNYEDAYEPWLLTYQECPASSKNVYIHGANILKYKYNKETDATKRMELLEELIKLYDTRIKYFGNDRKKGKDAITLDKVNDYLTIMGDKADYGRVYAWTQEIVQEYEGQSPSGILYWFLASSRETARGDDDSKKERYINDYLLASDFLDKQLEATADTTLRANLEINIAQLDETFARSGLASCELLKKIYSIERLESRKEDKAYLSMIIKLFQNAVEVDEEGNRKNECDSPVPGKAAEYLFALSPSAKAAMGLAGKYVREKDLNMAIKYLEEAIKLSTNNLEKVKCYDLMWTIAESQGNTALSSRAQSAILAINPNNGKVLVHQAVKLGERAKTIFPGDDTKSRCVYFAVIARLRQAASKDPSVATRANNLIARYQRLLPTQADIFMHPDLSGGTLNIPGYGTVNVR